MTIPVFTKTTMSQHPVWPFSSSVPKCQGISPGLHGQIKYLCLHEPLSLSYQSCCCVAGASPVGAVHSIDVQSRNTSNDNISNRG